MVALLACAARHSIPQKVGVVDDPHSFARPHEAVVTALSVHLRVDFDRQMLHGEVELQVRRHAGHTLVLDTSELTIQRITGCSNAANAPALPFALGATEKIRGTPLTIDLRPALAGAAEVPRSVCVRIRYATAPTAAALLWLSPAQTSGKQQPMLFSQSQAILARSWLPLQDTPSVRFTYEAVIDTPSGVTALMSAQKNGNRFVMNQPIPSYLMALAVGDFAFRELTPQSGVWAEPAMVDRAANEFSEIGVMMKTAERLYGPYRWDRYDILVLPPSFPYGGMENPRLTFLSPTVINGERSLVSTIAHELAHSWSGNLVTNATWNDFWLNEGFTTYLERRIMEEVRSVDAVSLSWHWGRVDLDAVIGELGAKHPMTRLAVTQGATDDPENVPSDIAYEKGALMLRALELAAGRSRFDAFLRARFDRLAFTSTTSATFVRETEAWLQKEQIEFPLRAWVEQPGLPADVPTWPAPVVTRLTAAAAAFVKAGTLPQSANWTTIEWVTFLGALGELSVAQVVALDAVIGPATTQNAELATQWLPRLIDADVRAALPRVEAHLRSIGRQRMIVPLYRAMVKQPIWRADADAIFAQAGEGYHPVTRATIAALLKQAP